MNTDRVLRMDLETGEFTEYPLPSQTNIRRVFVDNSVTPPSSGSATTTMRLS